MLLTPTTNQRSSFEFWKSIRYKARLDQKIFLLGILVLAGIVATAAGPSSAILMIPQNNTWPSGSITFYLNGSSDQLWPRELTASDAGGSNCLTSNATEDSHCAAGGYNNLFRYFSQLNSLPQASYFTFDIEDEVSMRSFQGNLRNDWQVSSETWVSTAHAATTAIEEPLREAWSYWLRGITVTPNAWRYGFSNVRTVKVLSQFPVTRTVCVPTTNLSVDTTSLPFPVLPEFDAWYTHDILDDGTGTYGNGPVYPISAQSSFAEYAATANNATSWNKGVKLNWVEPTTDLGSSSAAVALFFPSIDSNLSMALSCTVDSRWANGTEWVTSSTLDWGGAGYLQPMQSQPSYTRSPGYNSRLFLPINNTAWQRISMKSDFFAAMTPQTSSDDYSNPIVDTLEASIPNIINTAYPENYFSNHSSSFVPFVEQILSTFFSDSIARTGSYLQRTSYETLQNIGSDPKSITGILGPALAIVNSANTTIMHMDTFIQGYSYMLSGFTSYLSVAVLMLYCALALAHTVYILWSKSASSAWTTIPQLIVLAQNSEPVPKILDNTSVGIESKRVFSTKVRIMAVQGENRLHYVWGETEEPILRKRLIVDRCYG